MRDAKPYAATAIATGEAWNHPTAAPVVELQIGSYTKINSSVDAATTFAHTAVLTGRTYYWVVTAVNSRNVESTYSKWVSARIPTP